ncbi:hypothetical protein ACFVJ5_31035 [Nocardia sp. NPDC127606]|uniref:hypothetical protein n=1 Tax=Nocardia sp. NPDC127606 TaxID=3345406 RepID=UPI00362E683D
MRILIDAYGLTDSDRADVVDAMLDRQLRNARWWTERLNRPGHHPGTNPELIASRIAWSEREHTYTRTNRDTFEAILRQGE